MRVGSAFTRKRKRKRRRKKRSVEVKRGTPRRDKAGDDG